MAKSWRIRTHLARLRQEKGVERMEFVRKADMSYPTVVSWENGLLQSIDVNKLKNVMDLLDCKHIDEFVEFVEVDD